MTNRNLKILLPDSYKYHISKLYEGYHSGYPMVRADIDLLISAIQKVSSGLANRNITAVEITWTLEDMNHVLTRLSEWEIAKTLEGNRDAKVFIDALKQYFSDLQLALDEQEQ
ncbi:hypothetical protein [Hymenobacter crusticola]|uniref:Uncharacterized protein n=1 Tax=Hymenobacter crusticola TaxID=1770526 RepID=A0A243W5N5_9BACT|nr:hypothetical protein [Hymenobacter crusticola]OUJ68982.1 hypothetical protein BXP70_27135 [Hymenobacter crusticola]